jgi:hypothetical protein
MSIDRKYVTPAVFLAYVTSRGLRYEPITNSIQAAQQGAPLEVMGYKLIGPRGGHTTVCKNAEGLLSQDEAVLYADSVAYATTKLAGGSRG